MNYEEEDNEPWNEDDYIDGPDDQDDGEEGNSFLDGEMTDERWQRTPKTWSTLMFLTSMRPGNENKKPPGDEELLGAAIGLLNEDAFYASWSEKHGEVVFWPAHIPLDEITRDCI